MKFRLPHFLRHVFQSGSPEFIDELRPLEGRRLIRVIKHLEGLEFLFLPNCRATIWHEYELATKDTSRPETNAFLRSLSGKELSSLTLDGNGFVFEFPEVGQIRFPITEIDDEVWVRELPKDEKWHDEPLFEPAMELTDAFAKHRHFLDRATVETGALLFNLGLENKFGVRGGGVEQHTENGECFYGWSWDVEGRQPWGADLRKATISLEYLQRTVAVSEFRLVANWKVEAFHSGSPSWFSASGSIPKSLSTLEDVKLFPIFKEALDTAWSQVPEARSP